MKDKASVQKCSRKMETKDTQLTVIANPRLDKVLEEKL